MENERYVSRDAKHDGKGRYCFPEEVFHVTSYTHSPSPALLAYEEAFRSSRPKQCPGGGEETLSGLSCETKMACNDKACLLRHTWYALLGSSSVQAYTNNQ